MTATDDVIKSSLKQLLLEQPLSKITVADICERAGISRKTFYAHFVDKRDIITRIFSDDIIQPITEVRSLLPLATLKSAPMLVTEQMYQNFYANREYYEQLVTPDAQYDFVDMVASEITKLNMTVLRDIDLPSSEREYMAYFFAAAQAMLLAKWIREKMRVPPQQLSRLFTKWTIHPWREVYPSDRGF